jgi:hypothetical protein
MAESAQGLFALDAIETALDETKMPPNARKLLRIAEEEGWQLGPITLVARLQRADAQPFFARWDFKENRWSFNQCRALSPVGQGLVKLTIRDAFVYLQDPTVIYPEDPGETDNG